MDLAGRVMHEAITEEQLSKLSALTHRDVGSALNCWEQFWPIAWYGGMLRMCSLFSMLEWLFSGEQNKKG
jgi:hypothetical protein